MSGKPLAVLRLIFITMNWNKFSLLEINSSAFSSSHRCKNPTQAEKSRGWLCELWNYPRFTLFSLFSRYKEKFLVLVVLIDCFSNGSYMAEARKKKSVWVLHCVKCEKFTKNRVITVIHYCFLTGSILLCGSDNCTGFCFKKWQASYLILWFLYACDRSFGTIECDVTFTVLHCSSSWRAQELAPTKLRALCWAALCG